VSLATASRVLFSLTRGFQPAFKTKSPLNHKSYGIHAVAGSSNNAQNTSISSNVKTPHKDTLPISIVIGNTTANKKPTSPSPKSKAKHKIINHRKF